MYRKISPDLVVATNRGGAFSIGAIVLMSYLAFVETWAFVGSGDVREKIDVELGLSPARINIDIEFPKLNCDDATVELWRGKAERHSWIRKNVESKALRRRHEEKSALPEDRGRRQGRHVGHAWVQAPRLHCLRTHVSRYRRDQRPGGFRPQSSCGRFYLWHAPVSLPESWSQVVAGAVREDRSSHACNEHATYRRPRTRSSTTSCTSSRRSINCPIVEGLPRSNCSTRTTYLIKKQRARRS